MRIVKAVENRIADTDMSWLTLTVDIKGKVVMVGVEPSWDKAQIDAYLLSIEDELLECDNQLDAEVLRYELLDYTAGTLPQSSHIAALMSVDNSNPDSPRCNIRRVFMGTTYLIEGCRITQLAKDQYIDGKLKLYDTNYGPKDPHNKDSFVRMEYITENPFGEEITLPTVMGKVII